MWSAGRLSPELLRSAIEQVAAFHPRAQAGEGFWRTPLMACADARDPLFEGLRQTAHPGHLLPSDLLAGARTVVAYFLPFSRHVIQSNRKGTFQSELWARAYLETNELICSINERLSSMLNDCGYRSSTVAPTHTFDATTLLSPWSHRHAAYIAGLGTFGLNRLLITQMGCCGRLGSLVTDAVLPADTRPVEEFCSFRRDGSCGVCVRRCPSTALSAERFDRHACYQTLLANDRYRVHIGRADACGKCACGLPCSEARPGADPVLR
jgi:epoxyqueuosine reductase QueG